MSASVIDDFLSQVITTPEGYLNLCLRSQSGIWHEEFYVWPNQRELIVNTALTSSQEYDVYFSSYLYSKRDSHKDNVLPSRTLQQDLDGADPISIPIQPTALIQTSPHRYQGYWLVKEQLDMELHELLSKRLAYAIPNCDHSGWSLGHKVRLPGTYNHKYLDGPHPVLLMSQSSKLYAIEELELLPDVDSLTLAQYDPDFVTNPPTSPPTNVGPYELVESIKDKLAPIVYLEFNTSIPSKDRSTSLWALMLQCLKAGLTREETFWVAKHSPNNKFDRLRFHADRELAKDVLRAEAALKTQSIDPHYLINEARKKTKTSLYDRRREIYNIVLSHLKDVGHFIKTPEGRRFYILSEQGKPIYVGRGSEHLHSLLDVKFGLNRIEAEQEFVISSLMSYCDNLPETGIVATLSYYDLEANRCLIHSGKKLVYQITPSAITQVTDGAYDIVFPWANIVGPFVANTHADDDWGKVLFGNITNIINLDATQVEALLKTWLIFVLLRNASTSRPLLALFGQPYSGKTTLACKIYAFLYGNSLEVSGITNQESFDMSCVTLPVYAIDNVDTWERWLPDRLAQAARTTDVLYRKLYSDLDVVKLRRQAAIVITAYDPKFGRADVTSRLLILSMKQLTSLVDEKAILSTIFDNRNRLWGSLIQDIQRVLRTPHKDTNLQLRVQDFAYLGDWISNGLDCNDAFASALEKLRYSQYSFNLDEDHALVSALQRWLVKTGGGVRQKDDLFSDLLLVSQDQATFLHRYRNSTGLDKRLSALQSSLSTIMNIHSVIGKGGQRIWTIQPKE